MKYEVFIAEPADSMTPFAVSGTLFGIVQCIVRACKGAKRKDVVRLTHGVVSYYHGEKLVSRIDTLGLLRSLGRL